MPPSSRTAIGQLRGQLHSLLKPIASNLKKKGTDCVEGIFRLDLENFLLQLAEYGAFVVPVGELECWLKALQREAWSGKNEWLLRTFEAMGEDSGNPSYIRPESGDVWDFMNGVRIWLQNPLRRGLPNT